MTIALDQFTDPSTLGQYAGLIFLFFFFDKRTKRLEEKLERILGRLEGITRVVFESPDSKKSA